MNIRLATIEDLDRIQEIYAYAREVMAKSGNPNQWGNNRPLLDGILDDIKNEKMHLMIEDDKICAVFTFFIGPDPTYAEIDGEWLNDMPYGTIHKVASDGTIKNVVAKIVAFAETKIDNLRIDTHEDNKIMQALVTKQGFKKCGIIITDDGTPRIAYQRHLK